MLGKFNTGIEMVVSIMSTMTAAYPMIYSLHVAILY